MRVITILLRSRSLILFENLRKGALRCLLEGVDGIIP